MEFVNYLGCSPAISSGNVESQVRILDFEKPKALGGLSIETIRYPRCKHPISDPQALVARYRPAASWQCAECGNAGDFHEINWRKSFGYSAIFVEISAIFPKEALPADKLLAELSACSGHSWSWFYSRSSF